MAQPHKFTAYTVSDAIHHNMLLSSAICPNTAYFLYVADTIKINWSVELN